LPAPDTGPVRRPRPSFCRLRPAGPAGGGAAMADQRRRFVRSSWWTAGGIVRRHCRPPGVRAAWTGRSSPVQAVWRSKAAEFGPVARRRRPEL